MSAGLDRAALGFCGIPPPPPTTTPVGSEGRPLSAWETYWGDFIVAQPGSLVPNAGARPGSRARLQPVWGGAGWVRPALPEPYGLGAKEGRFPSKKVEVFFSVKGKWDQLDRSNSCPLLSPLLWILWSWNHRAVFVMNGDWQCLESRHQHGLGPSHFKSIC